MRTYRYKVEYQWGEYRSAMLCDFTMSAESLKEAKRRAEQFARVKEAIQHIKCQILKVCRA